jgi:hypothetical protein
MANDALDLLERYRQVALAWTFTRRAQNANTMTSDLNARAVAAVSEPPVASDDDFPF